MQPFLRNLVIVGGGTAGWMAAAALSSLLDPKQVSITLVESDEIGTVGVGEATIPDILNFNRMLGLDEAGFMKATDATFKLGIQFIDWGRPGDVYLHPFSVHGVDMGGIDFHQYWLKDRAGGAPHPIEDYSLCAVAAKLGRFTLPVADSRSPLSYIRYAYHFDATAYARYLRAYAEKRGVRRVEGRIQEVLQAPESGHVTQLRLERGELVGGDFFFDCTGFRALLIARTLGVPYVDWSHWLPCDSAQAVPCAHAGALTPYTRATARAAGWQWRIPTRKRTGNGLVYCREFMSDEEATRALLGSLDGEALGAPRQLRFTAGRRERCWEKNVIALGLASGFLEPLESTSIYLIQEGISRFIALFPDASLPGVLRDEYNRHMRQEYEQVRDFIILHYAATRRDDSPFWNHCRHMKIPDSLAYKQALFEQAGRVFRYEDELFARPSWVAVFLGQHVIPARIDPVVAMLSDAEVSHSLGSMRAALERAAHSMPEHGEFLARYLA